MTDDDLRHPITPDPFGDEQIDAELVTGKGCLQALAAMLVAWAVLLGIAYLIVDRALA